MKKNPVLIVIIILILSPSAFSYDFKTFTNQIDKTYEVQSAILNVKQIQKEIIALTHPDDINFSLIPGVKASTQEEGAFAEEIEIYGSASVKIPLALTDVERERLDFAMNALILAEVNLEDVREKLYIKIYTIYQILWLLQEEEKIINKEVFAAEKSLEIISQRFALGNIALLELSDADDLLEERNDRLLQNQLDQNISWFELKSLTLIESDVDALERLEITIEELPKPWELNSWIVENHPAILDAKTEIRQMEQTLKRLRDSDFDFTLRSSFDSVGNTYTANLDYDIIDPELTPSFSFPLYTYGEIQSNGGSSDDTWNLGLTFNLSLGSNRRDNLNSDLLETEILNARVKLEFLIEMTNLEIRSVYQQYLKNIDALELAERVLIRSVNNNRMVEAKKELKQVSAYEVLESESIVERNTWKIETARINVEKAWLDLLYSTVWFKKVDKL
jgi:outer membrane protein TolC